MRTLAEQIANCCKHFTGMQNKTCKVGISYDSVKGPKGSKGMWRLACFKDEALPCEQQSFPTADEVKAKVEESNRGMERVLQARKAIIATGLKQGAITCPKCGKEKALSFAIASNGHVHAKCKTGCVAWME